MGKKKNKQNVHKAHKAEDSRREPEYQSPPAKRKSHRRSSRQVCSQKFQSILEGWKKLTTQQKVLVVVMGLVATGVAVVVAYRLIPLIFEGVRTNPSEPPEFLTSMKSNTSLSEKDSHPVCPIRPPKESGKSAPSASSTPPVLSPAQTKQPKQGKGKKDMPAPVTAPPIRKVDIAKTIARARIGINSAWREELAAGPSGRRWISLIEGEVSKIKTLLPQTIHPKLLLKILEDPTFSIELVAYNDANLTGGGKSVGAMARYLPISNKLLIGSDTDMSDKEKLSVLRNEMNHVAIRYTNYGKQSSPEKNLPAPHEAIKILRPAIKDGWKTDPVLAKQHGETLKAGFDRIKTFKNLLKQSKHFKHGSLADKRAKDELNKWLKVVKNYTPLIYAEEMPTSAYRELEKIFKKEHGKTIIPHPTAQGYFISKETAPGGVILRYSFLKSGEIKDRAAAFIMDVEKYERSTGTQGGYSHYSDREDLDLELSSFIQEVDPNILEHFFPEWCSYFSDYHEVEGYCQTASLS
ncbi:hypothetical protein BH10PSE19_BH10PSE19_10490 [soil metagenome]